MKLLRHHLGGSVQIPSAISVKPPKVSTGRRWKRRLTVHALLAQHGWLGVLSPQARGVRRADLLRAGRAAAVVVHLAGLVDVRQETLVAVLICKAHQAPRPPGDEPAVVMGRRCRASRRRNPPVKSSRELAFSRTTSFSPARTSPPLDFVR